MCKWVERCSLLGKKLLLKKWELEMLLSKELVLLLLLLLESELFEEKLFLEELLIEKVICLGWSGTKCL